MSSAADDTSIQPVASAHYAEPSGSQSPTASGSAADAARPKRAIRPTVKALQAREQSPEAWPHGGVSRPGQPPRPIRSASGVRPQIKLKMKAGVGVAAAGAGQGFKTQPYMQAYDRELDSEDDETGEGLAFEEQLILRMPEGPECEHLRAAIQTRQLGDDVWFKFKDSRRAVVHVGESLFSAKLVDLPTITEAHKTLDSRQFFKVADIAQMLVVEEKIPDESSASLGNKAFNIDDFIYPHGITPPMKWARKRRFRKRTARRAIETVEKEVERLLKADRKAEKVEYALMDAAEDGGSEEDDLGPQGQAASPNGSAANTPMPGGSDVGSQDEGEDDDLETGARRFGQEEEYDDADEVDEDLAAELDAALEEEEDDDGESTRGPGSEAQSRGSDQEDLWDDDDDEDGDEGEEEDEEEDDENDAEKERRVREAQLEAECKEIEALVRRKQADVDSTMNLIIKNRHQLALRKLTVERDMKRNQLSDLKQARRERKEAVAAAAAADAASAAQANTAETDNANSVQDDQGQNPLTLEESFDASSAVEPSQQIPGETQSFSSGTMAPPVAPASRKPAADPSAMDVDTDTASQPAATDQTDDLWDDDDGTFN